MHAGDITAALPKTLDFSPLLEFLVGTAGAITHAVADPGCNRFPPVYSEGNVDHQFPVGDLDVLGHIQLVLNSAYEVSSGLDLVGDL